MRVVLVVIGWSKPFHDANALWNTPLHDVRDHLPSNPAVSGLKKAGANTADTVILASGFIACAIAVLRMVLDSEGVFCIGCHAGKHRSPVIAAAVREALENFGHSVRVLEASMVQPDMLKRVLENFKSWASGSDGQCTSISHYSDVRLENAVTLASAARKMRQFLIASEARRDLRNMCASTDTHREVLCVMVMLSVLPHVVALLCSCVVGRC